MKKKQQGEVNLFDLTPRRVMESRAEANGRMSILIPRFKKEWMRKILVPKSKDPNIQIALDEFGSHVWSACDGNTTVAEIAVSLRTRFGEAVEPVHDRLAVFIRELLRNGFISVDEESPGTRAR